MIGYRIYFMFNQFFILFGLVWFGLVWLGLTVMVEGHDKYNLLTALSLSFDYKQSGLK